MLVSNSQQKIFQVKHSFHRQIWTLYNMN